MPEGVTLPVARTDDDEHVFADMDETILASSGRSREMNTDAYRTMAEAQERAVVQVRQLLVAGN